MAVTWEFGPFRVDPVRRILTRDGQPVHLAPKAFTLLRVLLEHRGRVLSKEELFGFLWPKAAGTEANLSMNVTAVRRALGEEPHEHRYVVTIPQQGYSFVAEVRELHPGSRPGLVDPVSDEPLRRLAVLPFRLLHGRPTDGYLRLGLADALITQLSKYKAVSVRSTGSVRRFLDHEEEPAAVAEHLKVQAVLEGTVQRREHDSRVTVQLVDARGELIWASSYELDGQDVFRLQTRILADLTEMLGLESEVAIPEASHSYTEDIEAFQLYLHGRSLSSRPEPGTLPRAREFYERALAKDPGFALAYLGMAEADFALMRLGLVRSDLAAERIESEAHQALDLDDRLGEAHVWLANVAMYARWDWDGARELYRKALATTPHSSVAHAYYAYFLMMMGEKEEALERALQAQRLEPLSPLCNVMVGLALFFLGRRKPAVEQFQTVTTFDPRNTWGQFGLGWLLLQMGRAKEALTQFDLVVALCGESTWMHCFQGACQALLGERRAALAHLEAVEESARREFVQPYYRSVLQLALGRRERALDDLEKALEEHFVFLCFLNVDIWWDPVRDDPRFRALLSRMHLLRGASPGDRGK